MTTVHILLVLLGALTATVLIALGWAFLAIAKRADEQSDLPCCYRPNIVDREWQGKTGQFCTNCELWQAPEWRPRTGEPGYRSITED